MLLISVRLTVLSGGRETPAEYRAAEVPSIMALLLNMHVCLFFLVAGHRIHGGNHDACVC